MLVALAVLILVVELARHHQPAEALALAGLLAVVALAARWLVRDFLTHPSNFPAPSPSQSVRMAVAGAERARPRDRWASRNRTLEG